ncbi:putative sensor domain DACNV-containing protein [Sorangium sp. So ce341]|uniref:putative sensor domain DACNV-containing protein n=1 Tax=Sorangium sp. So ce341 TaxID=3133302 RepID=UPI003F6433D7
MPLKRAAQLPVLQDAPFFERGHTAQRRLTAPMFSGTLQYPRDALKKWLSGKPLPRTAVKRLQEIVDTIFFASLQKEEGEPTRVRVAYSERGIAGLGDVQDYVHVAGGYYRTAAWEIIPFKDNESVTALSVESLAKIAPAANLSRCVVVVGPERGGSKRGRLTIQGLARRIAFDEYTLDQTEDVLIVNAIAPAQLAISLRGRVMFCYEGGRVVDVSRRFPLGDLLFCEDSFVRRLLVQMTDGLLRRLPRPFMSGDRVFLVADVVHRLIQKMVSTKHGGIIAMLPQGCDVPAISTEGKYRLLHAVRGILASRVVDVAEARANLGHAAWKADADEVDEQDVAIMQEQERRSEEALYDVIDSLGQLTAIDNALLLGPDLQVFSAGYHIPTENSREGQLVVREASALEGSPGQIYDIFQHGSRHRAAASFARRYRGGLVFIASEDGPLRCLSATDAAEDTVLLWRIQLPDD